MHCYKILFLTILISVNAVRDKCDSSWFNNFCSDSCSSSSSSHCTRRRWRRPHRTIRNKCPEESVCSRSSYERENVYPCRPIVQRPFDPCFRSKQVKCYKGGRERPGVIFWELDRLTRFKEEELRRLFAGFTREALENLANLLKSLQTLLNSAVNSEYQGLGININKALVNTNTENKTAISNLIILSDATLLNGVQLLINTAATALNVLANQVINGTLLPAQLPAAITVVITTLSDGVIALFTEITAREVANVVDLLNASTTNLESIISGILAESNRNLNNKLNVILAAEFETFTKTLERHYGELLVAVERLFSSYSCEVRRLIMRLLCAQQECERPNPLVY